MNFTYSFIISKYDENLVSSKVLMQGKLIMVAYTLPTYWNQFSLGGICKQEKMHQCPYCMRGKDASVSVLYPRKRCISVGIVSEEKHNILIIYIIVSYDQNISLIFYVRLRHPSCVYITAQRQYTAVQKMRTPLK